MGGTIRVYLSKRRTFAVKLVTSAWLGVSELCGFESLHPAAAFTSLDQVVLRVMALAASS